MLEQEEYIEQAHFFRTLGERIPERVPIQDLLAQLRDEALSTTKLPMAIDFMLTELNHTGAVSGAMARLPHYFTPFQSYIFQQAEDERGRFDIRVAIAVLRFEAEYRSQDATSQGMFFYQFETLCRNRLSYDFGLQAMAGDLIYDEVWRDWILATRKKLGMVDFADLLYVSSEHYLTRNRGQGESQVEAAQPILFGEKEGKIALANRHKDPLFLFSALQRQLSYPVVPRPQPKDSASEIIPKMRRQLERLETRVKLLEDENRDGAFDITKFYQKPGAAPAADD